MRIRFQQQSEHSECGLACASMLIDYFSKRINLSTLRKEYGVPNGGYNLLQIQTVLSEHGVNSKAVKINIESLPALPRPFIAYWNQKHFIIIEKISKKYFHVIDPNLGKRKLSYKEFNENFSNIALYVTNDRKRRYEFPKINPQITKCVKNNKGILGKTLLISLIMQCLSFFIPYIIQLIIDGKVISWMSNIILFTLSIFFIFVFYFFSNMMRTRIITDMQISFDKELLSLTISQLLDLPYSYFVNRSKGELIYRINSNSYIRQVLVEQVIGLIIDVLFFFLYLIAMFSFNSLLTLITISIAITLCIFSVVNAKINRRISQSELVITTKSQDMISELVNNIFTIKSTNSQESIYKKWSANFKEQIIIEKEKAKYISIFSNIPQTLQVFYPLFIFFIGYILSENNQMTIGGVIAFNVIGTAFLAPLLSIMNSYNQLLVVKLYLERLLDILETPNETSLSGDKVLTNFNGEITIKNAKYHYSKFSKEAITDISLSIAQNEKIAIVGASGSGKSTLLKLAACLYKATDGEVFYEQQNVNKINIHKLREQIGVVLQENVLFNGTIKENITMGRNFSDEQIWASIRLANFTDLVTNFPLGLETHISESGQNLSGGQRQKISIARTIISKPKVVFLDEPTSALDNISENNVMNSLFKLECTLVVVAHRLSTIENFDKIIVMHEGKIVGNGTHSQLLNNNKYYQKLYRDSNTGEDTNKPLLSSM